MRQYNKIGIINVEGGATATVTSPLAGTNIVANQATICVADADPLVELFAGLPVGNGHSYAVKALSDRAEVRQETLIGRTLETITQNARYGIQIGVHGKKYEGMKTEPKKYAIMAPATLSGNAATDRNNIYTILKNKINADTTNNVEAILCAAVAFTTGNVALPVVGEVITETAGGETAIIAGYTITGGTVGGGNAAGILYLHTPNATWETGAATAAGGFTCDTTSWTDAQALLIKDDAGYYTGTPNRLGKSEISLYGDWDSINSGVGAEVETAVLSTGVYAAGIAGVYSRGIASTLTGMIPTYGLSGHDEFIRGDAWMEKYDASKSFTANPYATVIIERTGPENISPASGSMEQIPSLWILFVENASDNEHTYFDTQAHTFIDRLGTCLGCTPTYYGIADTAV